MQEFLGTATQFNNETQSLIFQASNESEAVEKACTYFENTLSDVRRVNVVAIMDVMRF